MEEPSGHVCMDTSEPHVPWAGIPPAPPGFVYTGWSRWLGFSQFRSWWSPQSQRPDSVMTLDLEPFLHWGGNLWGQLVPAASPMSSCIWEGPRPAGSIHGEGWRRRLAAPGSSRSHMFLWTDSTLIRGRRWPPGLPAFSPGRPARGTAHRGRLGKAQSGQAAEHSCLSPKSKNYSQLHAISYFKLLMVVKECVYSTSNL